MTGALLAHAGFRTYLDSQLHNETHPDSHRTFSGRIAWIGKEQLGVTDLATILD